MATTPRKWATTKSSPATRRINGVPFVAVHCISQFKSHYNDKLTAECGVVLDPENTYEESDFDPFLACVTCAKRIGFDRQSE